MNMRGDECDADEMMREGLDVVRMKSRIGERGDSENDDVKCDVMK